MGDGPPHALREILTSLQPTEEQVPRLPFSFVYDGQASSDLLAKWPRKVTEKRLDAERAQRVLAFTDPDTGLACEAQVTLFSDFPAVEWVLHFHNQGEADTPILEQVNSLDAAWPVRDEEKLMLYRSRGSSCLATDFQPIDQELSPGQSVAFAPVGGRSSNGALPFYRVQWPGGGVCVAVGWSGQWRACVSRDDHLRIQTGLDLVHTKLHPGENIRAARVLMVFWEGDDHQRGHNLYRQLVLKHYTPRVHGQLPYPIVSHASSYDTSHETNEENQLEFIRACKETGLEGYWLDAYWFEGYFPHGVGNWAIPIEQTVRKKDFPHGLEPLSDACRKLGLKFILWFEPERVAPETYIDRARSHWVLRASDQQWGLFNLGEPEARKWMTDYLCRCIEAYRLDVLRIDFNMDPLAHWRAADSSDRQGMSEIKYVMGLYQMWDEIIERFPDIFIDNCASGGRRIDLETNLRSIPMWRSDYNDNNMMRGDPIADQGMTMGLSIFMPINAGPTWRTDPYYWRSANVGGPMPYWDIRQDDYSREKLRQAIQETLELRPYLTGDLWHLTDNTLDTRAWAAYQFHRPEQDDGFAYFFRRKDSPYPALEVTLRGVSSNKRYDVFSYYGYELAHRAVLTAEELQSFKVEIDQRNGSLLVRYKPHVAEGER